MNEKILVPKRDATHRPHTIKLTHFWFLKQNCLLNSPLPTIISFFQTFQRWLFTQRGRSDLLSAYEKSFLLRFCHSLCMPELFEINICRGLGMSFSSFISVPLSGDFLVYEHSLFSQKLMWNAFGDTAIQDSWGPTEICRTNLLLHKHPCWNGVCCIHVHKIDPRQSTCRNAFAAI